MPYEFKHTRSVTLYTSGSKFDSMAKELLREYNADFDEINIRNNPQQLIEMISKSGQKQTPVTVVDGRVIVGFRPEMYELIFHQNQMPENTEN